MHVTFSIYRGKFHELFEVLYIISEISESTRSSVHIVLSEFLVKFSAKFSTLSVKFQKLQYSM